LAETNARGYLLAASVTNKKIYDDVLDELAILDLSEEEVESIEKNKSRFVAEMKDRQVMSTRFFSDVKMNDVIKNVSNNIVDYVVRQVCGDVFDSNLIAKLIQLELKN